MPRVNPLPLGPGLDLSPLDSLNVEADCAQVRRFEPPLKYGSGIALCRVGFRWVERWATPGWSSVRLTEVCPGTLMGVVYNIS